MLRLFLVAALAASSIAQNGPQCDLVRLENGLVCRCNSTYCDEIQAHPPLTDDIVVVYTTNEVGKRLEMTVVPIPGEEEFADALTKAEANAEAESATIEIALDGSWHQELFGFGGSFTDATAGVLSGLPDTAQQKFVSSYFSRKGGARYSMGRVPLGGSDFSTEPYSFSNTPGDYEVNDFVLRDDRGIAGADYKVELLLKAQREIAESTNPNDTALNKLQVFASVWSAPLWMKTCDRPPAPDGVNCCGTGLCAILYGRPSEPNYLYGGLGAAPENRRAYAEYWLKFIREYERRGFKLWGVTGQNEPDGIPLLAGGNSWSNTYYTQRDLADFLNMYLGPAIKAEYPEMKVMNGDDQYHELDDLGEWATESSFIDGVAYHWYSSLSGGMIGTDSISDLAGGQVKVSRAVQKYNLNNRNGNGFLLMSEACTGYIDNSIRPGSWERGINYMTSILHEVESGSAAWVDWNMALNMGGGPNWADNVVDAPILIDASKGEFYKQPMYYSLAHFSAFVPPGAIRLGVANTDIGYIGPLKALEVVAFKKAADIDECIMIIANGHLTASLPVRGLSARHTAIVDLPNGKRIVVDMGENEFKTLLFRCEITEPEEASIAVSIS